MCQPVVRNVERPVDNLPEVGVVEQASADLHTHRNIRRHSEATMSDSFTTTTNSRKPHTANPMRTSFKSSSSMTMVGGRISGSCDSDMYPPAAGVGGILGPMPLPPLAPAAASTADHAESDATAAAYSAAMRFAFAALHRPRRHPACTVHLQRGTRHLQRHRR